MTDMAYCMYLNKQTNKDAFFTRLFWYKHSHAKRKLCAWRVLFRTHMEKERQALIK